MIESPAIRADLHVEPLKSNLQETSKMKKRILAVAVAAVFTVSPVYAKKDKDSASTPQYEFVDGNGAVLGNVLFIEDRLHAFGYFDYLSTNSIIEVVATTSKEGEPINGYRFSGNFIQKNVFMPTIFVRRPATPMGVVEKLECSISYNPILIFTGPTWTGQPGQNLC